MTATLVAAPPATEEATPAERRPGTPTPVRLALGGVVSIAFVLNCWALSRNGLGNTYYSAAARSMTGSWRNFFFGAFDPGGFITVDKPPVALWIGTASVRIFGYSSWSLLLPSALAGTASVALLFQIVRRHFGPVAATIAALVLALSPVSVSVNRLNLPEPFMILFLTAAAWAVLRSLDAARPLVWLATAGAFAGLAFNTKTLAAAIAFPALGLAVLVGSPTWRARIIRGAVLAGVAAAASLWWVLLVDAIPASARPYVGGSKNDTEMNLLIGYNGLGRVDGDGQIAGGGRLGGGIGAAGGVFGGQPGKLRLLSDAVGSQIGWLLPIVAASTVASVWTYRKRRHRLAAVVLWSTWFWLYAIVFSEAKGIFHSYYTSALAPAVGALVGIGTVAAVRTIRRNPEASLAVATIVGLTIAVQRLITNRAPDYHAWAQPAMEIIVGVGLVALFATAFVPRFRRWVGVSLLVMIAGFLVAPTAWAWSETTSPVLNATLPQAGPRIGVSGSTFGSAAFDPDATLAEFLRSESSGEKWDLATTSAMTASGLIAQDGISVMAMGGFLGSDPATSVSKVAEQVKKGEIRFFLTGGGFGGRFGAAFGGATAGPPAQLPNPALQGTPTPPVGARTTPAARPPLPPSPQNGPRVAVQGGFGAPARNLARLNSSGAVMAAVEQVCQPLTYESTAGRLPNDYDNRIYDCRGDGDALAALG